MKRRSFVAAAGASLTASTMAFAQPEFTPAADASPIATPAPQTGLEMYDGIHGAGQGVSCT